MSWSAEVWFCQLKRLLQLKRWIVLFIIISSMLSSNSSGFEKEMAATRAYDLEDPLGQSTIEFVQAIDEFDLEQSCLLRLKAQRQKIEDLTKLYLEKEKELLQRQEQQKKLQEEVERLSDLTEYKQSYAELKRDYETLIKKEQITAQEYEALKKQFDQAIQIAQEQEEKLRSEIKFHKEQRLLAQTHWESIVADRDEEIKKQIRKGQQKEAELVDKINRLNEELEILQEAMAEKGTELESTSFSLKGQLQNKQEEIVNYDKLVECMRRQLSDYKKKFISAENEWQKEKDQLCETIDQLRTQLKLLKKDQNEKENEIYEYKEMIRRCDQKNQGLEQTVASLKNTLKKMKDSTENSLKKLTTSTEEEKGRLELLVHELKEELENQMEEKGTLALQVKRLRGLIERREQQEKQRKLLLMNEFREIDKLQKVVKKVI